MILKFTFEEELLDYNFIYMNVHKKVMEMFVNTAEIKLYWEVTEMAE